MGFYEFWGEQVDPGKVGKVELGTEHEACRCKPLVIGRFLVVAIALPAIWTITIPLVPLPAWQAAAAVIGGTLIYVAVSYLVDPQPEMDNLGPAGGMIDHPWRYSDDINRTLVGLAVILGPGRFIAESLMDIGVLFESNEPDPFADDRDPLPPEADRDRGF
jgi:hypothetical protein